jgi:membrane protease YdiL (CAAX protease family)
MFALAQNGMTFNSHTWTRILFVFYVLSPAISSFIVLKRNDKVKNLKKWLLDVFDLKCKAIYYLFTLFGFVVFFTLRIAISGLTEVRPIYMFFLLLPVMLICGGMEETGWRHILQNELRKKHGFFLSVAFIGFLWYAWHIPLFLIPGTYQYEVFSLWMYAPFILGLSFFLGSIYEISGSVFLCVLFHSMINAGFDTLISPFAWSGTIVTATVMILVSLMAVLLHKKIKNRAS